MQTTTAAQPRLLAVLTALAALVWLPLAPLADDLIWSGAVNNNWDYATANWSGDDTIFENGDNVTFNNTAGGTIAITAGVAPASTAISAAGGTYTFTGGPIAGAGTLTKTGSGILILNGANTYSGGTLINSGSFSTNYFQVKNVNALGPGTITIQAGTLGYDIATPTTIANDFVFTGSGQKGFQFMQPTSYTFTGDFTLPAGVELFLSRSGNHSAIISLPALDTQAGSLTSGRGMLDISNVNQIPQGNLNLNGDAGLTMLNNVSWAEFAAARPNGYGAGAGQWRASSGFNLAARGDTLVIDTASIPGFNAGTYRDAGGTLVSSYLDRNARFGSLLTKDGQLYADAPITIAVNTVLTARRSWLPSDTGPGIYGSHDAGIVHRIEGNITGSGCLSAPMNARGELVLAGLNTWTGTPDLIDIGDPRRAFSAGPGGLTFSRQHNDNVLIRFDGANSLPSGNNGATAYLSQVGPNTSGYLLTASPTGETYELPTGMKFVLGGTSGYRGVLGSSALQGWSATLQGSDVALHRSSETDAVDTVGISLVVRGGTLALGDTGKPVNFIPTYGMESTNTPPVINAPATTLYDAGLTTCNLTKVNTGTLILANVAYTSLDHTADKSSQFVWQIGRAAPGQGTTPYFDGAVRSLADGAALADNSNSLKNFNIKLAGGVVEIDGRGSPSSFTRPLGTAPGQVTWLTNGGGGFAAFNGPLTVNLPSFPTSWLGAMTNDVLMFGSLTANDTVTFQNDISMGATTREIRVIDNPDSLGDRAILTGVLSSSNANGKLNKTGAGILELRGPSTLSGGISVLAGTLLANNPSGSATGIGPVTVAANATLGGTGTIAPTGANSVTVSGTLAPGNSIGTLTFDLTDTSGGLTLLPGATLEFELGPDGSGDQVRLVGYQPGDLTLNNNLIDLINAGGLAKDTTYPLFAFFAADGVTPVEHGLTGGLLLGAVPGGFTGFLLDFSSNPSQIQLYVIPEPSTAALLLGLAALATRRRRR